METLAQSVSTKDSPGLPPGWERNLARLCAGTTAVLLVRLCIARVARHSASPGSLYNYASMILPPWLSGHFADEDHADH
jgi:hypothetical protein